jgi:D-3-phosphoglycerate dehydrogenase
MKGVKRILIIDNVHGLLVNGLREIGYEVDYEPAFTRQQMLDAISGYQGLIVRTKTDIDSNVLLKASSLEFIGRAGAGVDNIDTTFCDQKGIRYFNAGEANADAVGEHTLAMLLSLSTCLQKADKEVRAGKWDREGNRGWELSGKTVGIIGYGNTGKAVARKLSGFGVKVLAYDKYLSGFGDTYAEEVTESVIQQQAHIVTLHVPLTAETRHMINQRWIAECSRQIVLLNLSRGKVTNLGDVADALKNNKIRACGLDVLENEKLDTMNEQEQEIFDYLTKAENVVLSPHVGGWTVESYEKISRVLLRQIKELTNTDK